MDPLYVFILSQMKTLKSYITNVKRRFTCSTKVKIGEMGTGRTKDHRGRVLSYGVGVV